MCLLVGCIGILDLRLLGVAKGLPIGYLHRYVRWGLFGFFLNMTTGLLFFISRPGLYLPNPAFKWKMLFILIGGVNALLFYVSGLGRRVAVLGPGDGAPVGAKMIALVSLTVWVTVMILGRMLPYLG